MISFPVFPKEEGQKGASSRAYEKASSNAIFNRISDWFATLGKSKEEKAKILEERKAAREAGKSKGKSKQKVEEVDKQARKALKEQQKKEKQLKEQQEQLQQQLQQQQQEQEEQK